ncbi:MAG: F0F1 ATP synthase subunit B [Pseudomonadota bacterium]
MGGRLLTTSVFVLIGAPAFAAKGPFFSLNNTDFVVLLGFLVFIGILFYFGVHKLIGGMLDERADGIRKELDEARELREEAQSILATYERKQREVQTQADAIVAKAKEDAKSAAAQAKDDLKASLARRMQAAEDQIKSAEASAVKEVRDSAVNVAVAAAREIISKDLDAKASGGLIDAAIKDVELRLN